MRSVFERVSSEAGRLWCRAAHRTPMWPIHNYYVCPQCQRHWPVPWLQETAEARGEEFPNIRQLNPAHRTL